MDYTEEHMPMRCRHAVRPRDPRKASVRRAWTLVAVASGALCVGILLLSLIGVAWLKVHEHRTATAAAARPEPTGRVSVSVISPPNTYQDGHAVSRSGAALTATVGEREEEEEEEEERCDDCAAALSALGNCLIALPGAASCAGEQRLYQQAARRWQEERAAAIVVDGGAAASTAPLIPSTSPQGPGPMTKQHDPLETCIHDEPCHLAFDIMMECIKVRMLNPVRACDVQKEMLEDAVKKAMQDDKGDW